MNAYQGWFGRLSPRVARALHLLSPVGLAALRAPGAPALVESVRSRLAKSSTGGPPAEQRARASVHVVGLAYDERGPQLSEVHLTGPEGYEFTAAILGWGAGRLVAGAVDARGAVGPIEAFGVEQLESACHELGICRV